MAQNPIVIAFGVVVRSARVEAGFSQEELAERAGLDRTFVSMVERDTRKATLQSAKQIANALGLPLAELVARAERQLTA